MRSLYITALLFHTQRRIIQAALPAHFTEHIWRGTLRLNDLHVHYFLIISPVPFKSHQDPVTPRHALSQPPYPHPQVLESDGFNLLTWVRSLKGDGGSMGPPTLKPKAPPPAAPSPFHPALFAPRLNADPALPPGLPAFVGPPINDEPMEGDEVGGVQ
jgi:hypothetical protein